MSILLSYTPVHIFAHCRPSIAPLNAYLNAVSENNKKTIQFTLDMVAPLARAKPFFYIVAPIPLSTQTSELHVLLCNTPILQYTFFIFAHCRPSIAPLNAYLNAVSKNANYNPTLLSLLNWGGPNGQI